MQIRSLIKVLYCTCRFVFHELSGTKVDCAVQFPIDNLDLQQFISGPKTKDLQYSLYSCVCHFGGKTSDLYFDKQSVIQ